MTLRRPGTYQRERKAEGVVKKQHGRGEGDERRGYTSACVCRDGCLGAGICRRPFFSRLVGPISIIYSVKNPAIILLPPAQLLPPSLPPSFPHTNTTHRLIHQQKFEAKNHDETHDAVGDYVKSMIFGGLDGILTSFAIVAGAAGGGGLGARGRGAE